MGKAGGAVTAAARWAAGGQSRGKTALVFHQPAARPPESRARRGLALSPTVPPAEALRARAAPWRVAHYVLGEPGDCDPAQADWRHERAFDLVAVKDLLADWKKWFDIEIAMEEAAGIGCGYRAMLDEDIDDEIVVLMRGSKAYIWDGWHAVAAALISGRTTLQAIVGVPRPNGTPHQR